LDILIQTKKSPTPTKNHPITSRTSSNPGYPDSDKKIPKFPPKIIQQHPVNPQILDIVQI
ncbi:hypothetical protein, partial [Dolichospermum sp. UHCC 0352]|uniref:hypothetical protein n=1 Tax=Dolichospermum sp. UHCC 0352 TaxID=2590011 RepID=UPI001C2CC4A5